MNEITMKLNMDKYILGALQEDITSEDITTNSVMREYCLGEVELICKQDGVIAVWMCSRECLNCWTTPPKSPSPVRTATELPRGKRSGWYGETSECFCPVREPR